MRKASARRREVVTGRSRGAGFWSMADIKSAPAWGLNSVRRRWNVLDWRSLVSTLCFHPAIDPSYTIGQSAMERDHHGIEN